MSRLSNPLRAIFAPGRLALLLVLAIGFLATEYSYLQHQAEERISTARVQAEAELTRSLDAFYQEVEEDLHFLSEQALFTWQQLPDAETRFPAFFTGNLLALVHSHSWYDHVRWLSPEGEELIRLNAQNVRGEVLPVGKSQLQSKSTSPYFLTSQQLSPGSFFVSPLNLNREHGKIELPPRLTQRYVRWVHDDNGEALGALVLNLDSSRLQALIDQVAFNSGQEIVFHAEDDEVLQSNGFSTADETRYLSSFQYFISPSGPNSFQRMGSLTSQIEIHSSPAFVATQKAIIWDSMLWQIPMVLFLFVPGAATILYLISRNQQQGMKLKQLQREASSLYRVLDRQVIMCQTDTNGAIMKVNTPYLESSGYTEAELIGQTHALLSSGRHNREFYQQMWNTINKGRVWQGEMCNRNKKGQEYWVDTVIVPLEDESGEIGSFHSICIDTTERKQSNMMLAKTTIELAKAKASLEASLEEQKRLRQIAEGAAKAQSTFLATMSHEIRTPLNAVIGSAQLLEGESVTTSARDYIQVIREGGENLLGIINDVLDFTKIEANQLDLEVIPFAPLEIIEGVVALLRFHAEEKGILLKLEAQTPLPHGLMGDPTRLRQILVNLIGNAIKFTSHGSVAVRYAWQVNDDGVPSLRLEVEDTGIGIAMDDQTSLFDPFFQAGHNRVREHGGSGLGLAICKRLTQKMGGRIWLQSEEGVGSNFGLHLPLQGISLSDSERIMQGKTQLEQTVEDYANLRVLMAEDNKVNQRICCALLERLGIPVTIVEDGLAACQLIENTTFDVVLMDLQMPHRDGLESTRWIRANLPAEEQPWIIALTADAFGEQRQGALDAGVDDYVTKPLKLHALQRAFKLAQEHVKKDPFSESA